MIAERVGVTREKPNIAMIAVEYVGAGDGPSDPNFTNPGKNAPIIEVSAVVSQEPIETHPDFLELIQIPGEESNWPGVLITDDEGGQSFNRFPKSTEDGSIICPYHGVTSYLAPQRTCRRFTISETEPSASALNEVGKISDPPLTGQTAWLKNEYSYRREGGIYVITEAWLSPANGDEWDDTIYPG